MFDLDLIGTIFLIIAVLWLIAAVAYGRDDCGQQRRVRRGSQILTVRETVAIRAVPPRQRPALLLSGWGKPVTQFATTMGYVHLRSPHGG
jgi:hypothetical protein